MRKNTKALVKDRNEPQARGFPVPCSLPLARCAPTYTLFALCLSWWLIVKRALEKSPFHKNEKFFMLCACMDGLVHVCDNVKCVV